MPQYKSYTISSNHRGRLNIISYLCDIFPQTLCGLGFLISVVWTLLTTQRALIGIHTFSWGMSLTIHLIGCFVCFVWGASEEGLALRLIGFLEYTPLSSFLSHPPLILYHSSCTLSSFCPHSPFLFTFFLISLYIKVPSSPSLNCRRNTQNSSLIFLCGTSQDFRYSINTFWWYSDWNKVFFFLSQTLSSWALLHAERTLLPCSQAYLLQHPYPWPVTSNWFIPDC